MVVRTASWILGALLIAAVVLPAAAQRPRPCMGIGIAEHEGGGVMIRNVEANSPADLAWLRAGDVIQGMIIAGNNDRPVRTVPDLMNLMSQLTAGDTVIVRFQRGTKRRMAQVTVRAEPRTSPATTN